MNLVDFLNAKSGTAQFDWEETENELGFQLHEGLKSFYSKAYERFIRGEITFKQSDFVVPAGNEKFDKWFSFNKVKGEIEIKLYVIKSQEDALARVTGAYNDWKGRNDFGQRFLIGNLYTKIGTILILFNNETGKVEWMDCEYGHFNVYEENPNGVFADNMDEFIEKLSRTAIGSIKLWDWDKKPRTMKRYLGRGDIFCFVYDDNRFCFGRIIEINLDRLSFCVAEIFDHISETPTIDEQTIVNAGRIIPPININACVLFDQKLMGGDWRIIGHQDDYLAPDYDELYIGRGQEGDWKKADLRGVITEASKEEYDKCISNISMTDYTVKELLKGFYGERQVRKTEEDIRKAIGIVKNGMKEYLEALEEVPDLDINSLDRNKCSLLQNAVSSRKWDIAKDLVKRGIDVNNQDKYGSTALHYLSGYPADVELVEEILKAGGDPNIRNNDKISPLYQITSNTNNNLKEEKYQVLDLLLKYGGDKTLPCSHGWNCVDTADEIGDKKTIEILKQYEPRPKGINASMDAEELGKKIDKYFAREKYFEVVDALYGYPDEKMTLGLLGILIPAYNNLKSYDKALACLEKYKTIYADKMRIWYYFATYAYVQKTDSPKATECIEAGIAECNKEKEEGVLVGERYTDEINDFENLRKMLLKKQGIVRNKE